MLTLNFKECLETVVRSVKSVNEYTSMNFFFKQFHNSQHWGKECRISVRGETLYLTMLSAVTPTQ